MCGICGYTKFNSNKESNVVISEMLDKIQHRGPDNTSHYETENISLGHVRLSIIDLTEKANQPFILHNRYILVYNGEVYNFKELKDEMIANGCKFETNSDTEVIIMGYANYGIDFFKKMNGMFAFAIYDLERYKLTLVRDRFGIKPLYYTLKDDELVFASEIKSILAYTQESIFNTSALGEFLYFGNALGIKTMYKDIFQLKPGCYLEYSLLNKKLDISDYWNINNIKINKSLKLPAVKETLLDLLENAVKDHLVSDVSIGLFLSGGIDSSLIAHYASKHSKEKITAYTASFEYDKGINEVDVARKYALELGIDHEEIPVKINDLPEIIEKMVYHHDAPFSDAANIPLYLMSKTLKGKHKVVLQGDGGDEFFAGYRRYRMLSKFGEDSFQLSLLKKLTSILSIYPVYKERVSRINSIFSLKDDGEKMARLLTAERPSYPAENILSEAFKSVIKENDPFMEYRKMSRRLDTLDPVQKMLFTDTQIILPNIFFEKVDRSTMANSIEARIPFLDNNLTEYALSLDASMKLLNQKQKGLLLHTIKGLLPDYITKKKKVGFSVPFENWIKGPLRDMFFDYLYSDKIKTLGLYNTSEIENCFKLHKEGKADKGFLLWKILNLNIFLSKGDFKM